MKVLKPGREQRGWTSEQACTGKGNGGGGCGALLLVEAGDLFFTYSFDLPTDERHVTFACPECRVKTDLGYGEVPGGVVEGIKKGRRVRE